MSRRDQIEPQLGKVGQIVARERFAAQVMRPLLDGAG